MREAWLQNLCSHVLCYPALLTKHHVDGWMGQRVEQQLIWLTEIDASALMCDQNLSGSNFSTYARKVMGFSFPHVQK